MKNFLKLIIIIEIYYIISVPFYYLLVYVINKDIRDVIYYWYIIIWFGIFSKLSKIFINNNKI